MTLAFGLEFQFYGFCPACARACCTGAPLPPTIVEDSLVHVMVNRAAKRHEPVCHYSRVIPGWLTDPVQASHAWRMVAAIQWVPAMLTQFAFALRELGWL